MSAAEGSQAFLGMSAVGGSGNATVAFDFRNEGLGMVEDLVNGNGVRGTRSHSKERVRAGLQRINGNLEFQPGPTELSNLLQWIMGGSPTGSGTVSYPFAETLPARDITIDRITKVFSYAGAKCARATFRCSQGTLLNVSVDVVAKTESIGNAGTFPSLTLAAEFPFFMSDLTLVINGTTVTPADFVLTIDNNVDRDRFFNSLTLVTVETQDRVVTFSTNVPYGDFSALYNAGSAGVTLSAVFNNTAGGVLTITSPALVFMRDSPNVPGKDEIMLPISGRCMKSTTNAELAITLAVS